MSEKLQMLFTLPKTDPDGRQYNCQTFVLREMDGLDEMTAGIHADRKATKGPQGYNATVNAERRESLRLAFVAVDDKSVNVDGEPFIDLDGWSAATLFFAQSAYNKLNGVEKDELDSFLDGATVVGPATKKNLQSVSELASITE